MNGVDILCLVFLGANAALGAVRGMRRGIVDFCSIVFGLLGGLLFYPVGQWLFGRFIGFPDIVAGPAGFVLGIAVTVLGVGLVARRFVKREEKPSWLSRTVGGLLGLGLGAIGLGALLPIAGLRWVAADDIRASPIGSRFVAVTPWLYETVERLGLDVPKVAMVPDTFEGELSTDTPRRPRFRPINFTALDHSTCIKCGADVRFKGYKHKDGIYPFPKFECSKCGRTSDGCQTYEGFHKMYEDCPVRLAQDGGTLDCGVWTNDDWVTPHGPCPTCGRVLIPRPAEAR
jgi:hypothetical protein